MHIRFRVADSLERLFAAPSLSGGEREHLPDIGDQHEDRGVRYRVVKVLPDVDPEHGAVDRGPVVYVVKITPSLAHAHAPKRGLLHASFMANVSHGLRECIERANAARRQRHAKQFRQHLEEFMFLSHAAARLVGSERSHEVAPKIPYLPVYGANEQHARALRDGLILCSFSAHVAPMRSLATLAATLDRMDATRPTVVIITEPITLPSGLNALSAIRAHPLFGACLVLVLTQPGRDEDGVAAVAAGATAASPFPATIGDYPVLVARISALLTDSSQSAAPTASA